MSRLTFTELTDDNLEECFRLCMRSLGEDNDWDDAKNAWELCRNDPHYRYVVGTIGGKVAAFAVMSFFHTLFDGTRPTCSLWYVCVSEEYRRQGLGRELFREIERIAVERNVMTIGLSCLKGNVSACEFYRSLGYSDEAETAFVKYYY